MGELRTREVDNLLGVLARMDDPDELFKLLEDLFTIREIKETSQRLDVARMLAQGTSYSNIEQATGASATTIARVSKCLAYGTGGYVRALALLEGAGADGPAAKGPDTRSPSAGSPLQRDTKNTT